MGFSLCRNPPPSPSIVTVQFLGRLTTAVSDKFSSGARCRQGGRVSCRQRHIGDIPEHTHRRRRPPHPLPIVGVPHFSNLIDWYITSGGRSRVLGVTAAGDSEPIGIAAPENFVVNTGMMAQRER